MGCQAAGIARKDLYTAGSRNHGDFAISMEKPYKSKCNFTKPTRLSMFFAVSPTHLPGPSVIEYAVDLRFVWILYLSRKVHISKVVHGTPK